MKSHHWLGSAMVHPVHTAHALGEPWTPSSVANSPWTRGGEKRVVATARRGAPVRSTGTASSPGASSTRVAGREYLSTGEKESGGASGLISRQEFSTVDRPSRWYVRATGDPGRGTVPWRSGGEGRSWFGKNATFRRNEIPYTRDTTDNNVAWERRGLGRAFQYTDCMSGCSKSTRCGDRGRTNCVLLCR